MYSSQMYTHSPHLRTMQLPTRKTSVRMCVQTGSQYCVEYPWGVSFATLELCTGRWITNIEGSTGEWSATRGHENSISSFTFLSIIHIHLDCGLLYKQGRFLWKTRNFRTEAMVGSGKCRNLVIDEKERLVTRHSRHLVFNTFDQGYQYFVTI